MLVFTIYSLYPNAFSLISFTYMDLSSLSLCTSLYLFHSSLGRCWSSGLLFQDLDLVSWSGMKPGWFQAGPSLTKNDDHCTNLTNLSSWLRETPTTLSSPTLIHTDKNIRWPSRIGKNSCKLTQPFWIVSKVSKGSQCQSSCWRSLLANCLAVGRSQWY